MKIFKPFSYFLFFGFFGSFIHTLPAQTEEPLDESPTEIEINQSVYAELNGTTSITRLAGPDFFDQEVQYVDFGSFGIYEGDIYIDNNTNSFLKSDTPSTANGIAIDGYRWPNRVLPYRFGSNVTQNTKVEVRNAARRINDNTNVSIIEISSPTKYHVLITTFKT